MTPESKTRSQCGPSSSTHLQAGTENVEPGDNTTWVNSLAAPPVPDFIIVNTGLLTNHVTWESRNVMQHCLLIVKITLLVGSQKIIVCIQQIVRVESYWERNLSVSLIGTHVLIHRLGTPRTGMFTRARDVCLTCKGDPTYASCLFGNSDILNITCLRTSTIVWHQLSAILLRVLSRQCKRLMVQ
jgi:hypothetical protein